VGRQILSNFPLFARNLHRSCRSLCANRWGNFSEFEIFTVFGLFWCCSLSKDVSVSCQKLDEIQTRLTLCCCTLWLILACASHCFDTVGWATCGGASHLQKTCSSYPQNFSLWGPHLPSQEYLRKNSPAGPKWRLLKFDETDNCLTVCVFWACLLNLFVSHVS